jgi:hypothetical protein
MVLSNFLPMPQTQTNESRPGGAFRSAARICCNVFGFGSIVAGTLTFFFVVLSLVKIGIGLWKCALSLWDVFRGMPPPENDSAAELYVLRGLEVLLLSPCSVEIFF